MVRITPIHRLERIEIDRDGGIELSGDRLRAVNDAWLALCEHSPRYFNGSILAFDGYDPQTGVIRARIEQFKHHAVRGTIDLGISLLAVTVVLCVYDTEKDSPAYLLGKRSEQAHRYGGRWELGPSGGIDVPDRGSQISYRAILKEVEREVREEIDFELKQVPYLIQTLEHDDEAGSVDIVVAVIPTDMPEIRPNWEYTEPRWVTLDELVAWADERPQELIPTTAAHARFLHRNRD